MIEERPGRDTCYECFRPKLLCYCAWIEPFEPRTRVVIVQHPRERFHPLNTARLVERSVPNSQVLRGDLSSLQRQVEAFSFHPDAAILFPSSSSVDVASLAPEEYPSELIVIDGTWPQAKVLLREIPRLGQLRHVRFTPPAPSTYRIRKPPGDDCLSTLESIAHMLRVLEPEQPSHRLVRLFERFIDKNIAERKPGQGPKRFQSRGAETAWFPEQAVEGPGGALLVYAEALQGETDAPLVVETARFEGSEWRTESIWFEKDRPVAAGLLTALGQSAASYAAMARPQEGAFERLRALIGASRVVVVWNGASFRALGSARVHCPSKLVLKGAFSSIWFRQAGKDGVRWGGIEDAFARERLELPTVLASGRGALRIAQTIRLWEHLCALSQAASLTSQ
jgi:DTW domain-containing protein